MRKKKNELESVQHLATGVVVGLQFIALGHVLIRKRELNRALRQMTIPSVHSTIQILRRRCRRGLAETFASDVEKTRRNLQNYTGNEHILAEAFVNAERLRES